MKVKIITSFTSRYDHEAQEQINDFIRDKDVVDIKIGGSRNEYGEPVYQYIIIYKEEKWTN